MPAPPPPAYKSSKWPTHATITADVILGDAKSDNFVHDLEATIYDDNDDAHTGTLNVWSREVPPPGVYLVNNAPFANDEALELSINDGASLRRLPDDLDGLDPDGYSLPVMRPIISGIGVSKWSSEDRKEVIIVGWTYLSKKRQWQKFVFRAKFEDGVRWEPWFVVGPRFKVAFECVLIGRGPDGLLDSYIRRMTQLDAASPALLQSLEIGQTKQNDRAAKYKEVRAMRAGAKRPQDSVAVQVPVPTIAASSTMTTPRTKTITAADDPTDAEVITPAAPKLSKHGVAPHTPSSPTTGLLTRKRARIEAC
ncbi:hypothetical protein OC842_006423 [Tilletia horrida]|uniref:Uncharacterized protein n=1 Tax=Tilletia horrida TaxID=155126 RepID=A0AAN6G8K2_9BASI|nr:hypothetical protein OC842_006423 [Tilletia horrida]